MADATSKLLLQINAATGEANRALDKLNRQLGQLTKTQRDFGEKAERAGNQFGTSVSQIAAGVIVANLATRAFSALGRSITGLLSDSVSVALTFERQVATLPALARNTGRTKDEVLALINAIREEDKSIVEAIEITKGIIIAELGLADGLKLVATARDIGAVAGVNSARVNRLILESVQTLNPGLLKMVGLNVSLQVVFREAAEALGKQRAELTTAERQAALFNAIIQEGAKFQGAYNLAMQTAQKVLGSVRDSFKEVQLAIGFVLTRALQPILKTTLEANRAFRAWAITADGELNPALIKLGQVIGTFVLATFNTAVELTKGLIKFMRELFVAMSDLGVFKAFGTALQLIGIVIFSAIDAVRLFKNSLENFFTFVLSGFPQIRRVAIDAILKIIEVINKAAQFLAKFGIGSGIVFEGIQKDLQDMRSVAEVEIEALEASLIKTDSTLLNFLDNFDKAKSVIANATFGISSAWKKAQEVLGELDKNVDEVTESIEDLSKTTKELAKEQERALGVILDLWNDFIKVIDIFDITTQQGFGNFVALLQDTELDIDTFAETFRQNFDAIQSALDETVDAHEDKLGELERLFEQTQQNITNLIAQNAEAQMRIQLSAQDAVARAVLKADEQVARLRQQVEDIRVAAAEKTAKRQAKLDDDIATERGRIAVLLGQVEEKTGKKRRELLTTIATREEALINFEKAGIAKVTDLRDKELGKITEVEAELIKQQTILARAATLERGFIEAINQARADASLNEIDRILIVAARRQTAREAEFQSDQASLNTRLGQIQTEGLAIRAQLNTVKLEREVLEKFITDLLKENLSIRRAALDEDFAHQGSLIATATAQWQNYLAIIRSAIGGAITPVGPPAITPFQKGGIVTRPTIGLLGEAGPEAIIPLRRGGGAIGGNITINITGNTILGADKELLARQIGDAIFRRLNMNIRLG